MIKKIYIFFSIFLLINIYLTTTLFANIEIIATVDNEIITNYDIKKEENYLKILNPNLKNLKEIQLLKLAKESLIKEIIKKKTISKFVNLQEKNLYVENFYQNLIIRLGFENENSFKENILNNKTYSSDEIKLKISIELFWNDLIFNNYNNQIKIDEKKIIKSYKNAKKEKTKEILISEIVFRKVKNEKIENTIYKIKKSIEEIGFENTANLFSITDTSKYGGKVGWIEAAGLTEKIYNNIINLEPNEYSNVINIDNNFIILKVNDVRISKNKINDNEEIQKLIENKKNQKLEQFSRIYFNKIKNQFLIYEK